MNQRYYKIICCAYYIHVMGYKAAFSLYIVQLTHLDYLIVLILFKI